MAERRDLSPAGRRSVGRPHVDPATKTETLSVRLSRGDFEKVRALARREDRPITTQCRVIIRGALAHLGATADEAR